MFGAAEWPLERPDIKDSGAIGTQRETELAANGVSGGIELGAAGQIGSFAHDWRRSRK